MAEILKFVYIMILCVSLLLIVEAGGSKFILLLFLFFLSYAQTFNHF